MEKKKEFIVLTFILAIGGIALVVASLATDHWVESTPESQINGSTSENNEAYFGLFNGYKKLDYLFGARTVDLAVSCDGNYGVCAWFPVDSGDAGYIATTGREHIESIMSNRTEGKQLYEDGLFSYGMWVTAIIAASLSIVFGLISLGFALFNILGKPIETITGPLGLYLWNGIAFLFSLIEMIIFLVLYLTTFSKNFLSPTDADRFMTEGHTSLGFSFYLPVGSVALYLVNILLLFCSGYKLRCSFSSEAEKVVDNGMILY